MAFHAIDPKAEALAFEDAPIGRYARSVQHTHQRIRCRTKTGMITLKIPVANPEPTPEPPAEAAPEAEAEFVFTAADLRPVRRRP